MMQEWFKDAKFGIFIHWGIYAVNGIPCSWPIVNGEISYNDYLKQCENFTATNYDPKAWAKLFKAAGAQYAVLTTKHHDGIALWDTKESDLSVIKKTPAKKDLVGPFCEAMRKEDIKVGLYYSHIDWSREDYMTVHCDIDNNTLKSLRQKKTNFMELWKANEESYNQSQKQVESWEKFLTFHKNQVSEILGNYGPVDLLFFDVMYVRKPFQWHADLIREHVHSFSENTVINGRLTGYGDYSTPERALSVVPPKNMWEYNVPLNNSFGYRMNDRDFKTPGQIIRILCECVSMGGNLLLGIGPKPDGSIIPEFIDILTEVGKWIKKNEESIYGTIPGLSYHNYHGLSSMSKDKKSIYLFTFSKPLEGVMVNGLKNKVDKISVLSSGEKLNYRIVAGSVKLPGMLFIDLPEAMVEEHGTVIKLNLTEPLDVYCGESEAINEN